jgi:hypothetical protein
MHQHTVPPAALLACTLAGLLLAGCSGSQNSSQSHRNSSDDLNALQGNWEQLPEDGPAATPGQRVVKQVSGDSETVTTYDESGGVVHGQTAKFRLGRSGQVPTYTFYDRKITTGSQTGRSVSAPSTFVYRLRGDEFHEVWGLLPGQEERELVVKRWKRVAK